MTQGHQPRWVPGDPWVECDVCGKDIRRSESRRRWDNHIVCPNDWEPQHPQEFLRGKSERVGVKNARPKHDNTILTDDATATTDWTLGANWAHRNSIEFFHTTGAVNTLQRALTGLVTNGLYEVFVSVSRYAAGTVTLSMATANDEDGDLVIGKEPAQAMTFTADATTDTVVITPSTDFNGVISALAVYKRSAATTGDDL